MALRRGRPRLTPSTLPPGCRRHGRGIQAKVVRHGHPSYQAFPLDTPNAALLAWQKQEAANLELRYGGHRPVVAGTFAADASRYLRSVTALADYAGRAVHIALWVDLFGDRRRHTIRPDEIRAQRDRWLTVGPKRRCVNGRGWVDVPEPLAASTVSHRLRALENLWTVLDTKHAYNPVRDVPEPREPDARPRAIPYDVLEAILAAMPETGQGLRGKKREGKSKTKARLRLMAFTGLTNSQIAHLTPADFDFSRPAIRRKARSKGKGASGGWFPVPADAAEAMRAFETAQAWGTFSRSSLHKSFRRACKALNLPANLTPYMARHSYVSAILKQTGDIKATQQLVQHADTKTTMRYALGEVDDWLAGAMAKVTGLRQRIAPDAK